MIRKSGLWAMTLMLLISACSFDQDEEWRPASEGILLLAEGELFKLKAGEKTTITNTWGQISDIAADQDGEVWCAFPDEQNLRLYDPKEDALSSNVYETAPLTPHFCAFGPQHLVVVDSQLQKVGFFDKKSKKLLLQIDVPEPRAIEVLVDKYYVISQDSLVRIFLDQALTEIGSIKLPRPIDELRKVQDGSLILNLVGQPLRAANVQYLTDGLRETPFNRVNFSEGVRCVWEDQHYPPTTRALFGTEWTSPVGRCEEHLRSNNVVFGARAEDLVVDFFNATVYYLRSGRLYYARLPEGTEQGGEPWAVSRLDKALPIFSN